MRKALLLPLLALVFAATAMAGSGTATKFAPYDETMTTSGPGTVSVSFVARRNVSNALTVWRDAGTPSETGVCFVGVNPASFNTDPTGPTTLTCNLDSAGTYLARFSSSSGAGTAVTMTWTP